MNPKIYKHLGGTITPWQEHKSSQAVVVCNFQLFQCSFGTINIITYIIMIQGHKTAPSYLCDLITPYSNSCNLRSNNQLLLASCQPRTKLKTYGERSFQYAAPNEWNNLPLIIRESPSLAIFKNKLKTFLFHSTFST